MEELQRTLGALEALGFDAGLDDDPGEGWMPLADLASGGAVLDAALCLSGQRFGMPVVSRLSGAWLIGDVAAALAWPAAAALLTSGVVLVTGPDRVHVPHPSTGRRLGVRLAPPEAPAQAEAADGRAQAFANGFAAALAGVVEGVHRGTGRGRHALAATAADMVAAAFHRLGDHLGCSEEARRLADAVIGCSALPGGTNWHEVTWPGGVERTRIRNICCLWYRTPGGDLCLTCPRIDDARRRQLLQQRA